MIVVNFKAYSEASGKDARDIAKKCETAGEESGKRVVVTPSHTDILRIDDLDLEIFSQGFNPVEPGSHTGSVTVEQLKDAGATGSILNHSENRMDDEKLRKAVEKARENNLTSIVCAQTPEECKKFSRYEPDYVAFEPPELIGGDTSVSESEPELIQEAVKNSEVPTLTGAGIKDKHDVEKSIELGCEGVLVASGVVKADDVVEEVKELCRGL